MKRILFVILFVLLFIPQVSAHENHGDYPNGYLHSKYFYANSNDIPFHRSNRFRRFDEQKIENAREYFNNNADFYKNSTSTSAIYLHGHIVHL